MTLDPISAKQQRLSSHGAPDVNASHLVKILVDYRPALRARTGVGEYMRQLVRSYTSLHDDTVAVFTASWKDRPAPGTATELAARVVDRRIPVRLLNLLWHRLGWPPVEMLAGAADIVHAA